MAFKLEVTSKLPFFGRKVDPEATQTAQSATKSGARAAGGRRLQLLIAALIALLAIDAAVVAVDTRQGTFGTIYIATVGKIRMLSQRLAKAAQQASQGNREAFKQLRESRDEFAASMKLLLAAAARGGRPAGDLGARAPALDALDAEWKKSEKNSAGDRRGANLLALGAVGAPINAANPRCRSWPTRSRRFACKAAARAAERADRAADDADAAHGEERQHHARRARDRPGSVVPARQGHQHLPRHAARA
jgi:hypothetical protein